jgi:hypothetical protein
MTEEALVMLTEDIASVIRKTEMFECYLLVSADEGHLLMDSCFVDAVSTTVTI